MRFLVTQHHLMRAGDDLLEVRHSTEAPTPQQLRRLFMRGMVPMIGFGFLDNFIMITAGDVIDTSLGSSLHLSTLAAAGLGNLVSDVAGLGFSGTIEATASRIGLPSPALSIKQLEMPVCRSTMMVASIIGISIGCLLGMVPLLFMDTRRKVFFFFFFSKKKKK